MKKLLLAPLLLAAAAAGGFVAGILMAPHKGTITRAKLRARMAEEKEKGEEKALEMMQRAKDMKSRKIAAIKNQQ